MHVKTLLGLLLDLLFPPRCPFCRGFLAFKETFCTLCKDDLPFLSKADLFTKGNYFSRALAPLAYEGMVRDALHRYKFEGKAMYAPFFAQILAESIAENLENCYDIITYVPVSKKRKRKRGYDQAELLAKQLANILNKPLAVCLEKSVHTKAQSGLEHLEARFANVRNAYHVIENADITEKRILLVDDVITTGATLSEAAKCLLKAGAEEVLCASLAKTIKQKV